MQTLLTLVQNRFTIRIVDRMITINLCCLCNYQLIFVDFHFDIYLNSIYHCFSCIRVKNMKTYRRKNFYILLKNSYLCYNQGCAKGESEEGISKKPSQAKKLVYYLPLKTPSPEASEKKMAASRGKMAAKSPFCSLFLLF